jgi:phosphoglycerate dehydrogenase-like enzyme
MKVVLLGSLASREHQRLVGKLKTDYRVVSLVDTTLGESVAAELADTDVIITLKYNRGFPPAPKLRLLQSLGAGTDAIETAALPAGAVVCNAFGHDEAIGEFCVLGMLAWSHDLLEAESSFRAGSWRMSGRMGAPIHEELFGKTVGILGLGRIGLATAVRAKPFGMTVLGCARSVPATPPVGVDRVYPMARLDEFLPLCDFLVVACALTPETTGLIEARRFSLMKRSAVLINVARGEVVDEDALFRALKDKTIAGGVIDAWYAYPKDADDLAALPSRHPFHELRNVIMTPHSSAWTHGMLDRRWNQIAGNLDRLQRGEPLINVVARIS